MANITVPSSSPTINELLATIDLYKVNPTMINRVHHRYLKEVTGGKVNLVDPTNPFVYLLEASAINTAACINENIVNLRKQYPYLAQTPEELHLHMSDIDYVDRFSKPSTLKFTFVVNLNDILYKMKYDAAEETYKVVYPRDTFIEVTGYTFTFQYPIEIKRFLNGTVQISYVKDFVSPLQSLTTNIIDFEVRIDEQQVKWVFFNVELMQMKIDSYNFALARGTGLEEDISFEDKYYYSRAFYRNNSTANQWREFNVTYTDQVFDLYKPTLVMSVYEGKVHASIPAIYTNTSLQEGDIRVDVYTTKGNIVLDMSSVPIDSYEATVRTIDKERDMTDYVSALADINYYVLSNQVLSGGSDGLSFYELRQRVLYNSLGLRQLPITNIQLANYVEDYGFELVKDIDVVTNRVFLAIRSLPKPSNPKLLTPANIGISSFISTALQLQNHSKVRTNSNRTTILAENIFLSVNGILYLLSETEQLALRNLPKSDFVDKINSGRYLYNPYYYVLDASDAEFSTRVYHLDQPEIESISFELQNSSLKAPVNTELYELIKTNFGYRLLVTTKSGNFFKMIEQTNATVQFAFYSKNSTVLSYINGELLDVTQDQERIFGVDIHTNYDLDSDDRLCVTNAYTYNKVPVKTWMDLNGHFELFYTTRDITTDYVPSSSDALLGKFLFPVNYAVLTHEKFKYKLGDRLKLLWSRSRSFLSGVDFLRYEYDIPAVHTKIEYLRDPQTGSIFSIDASGGLVYNVIHNVGDPILDNQGLPVYKHRKGDIILDQTGEPIVANPKTTEREVDMLLIDAKYIFADDTAFVKYREEASGILAGWITTQIKEIQKVLLEKTVIYYYPKTTLSKVKVYIDNSTEDIVDSEQSLSLTLYVKDRIYRDNRVRQDLVELSVSYLDKYISNVNLSVTDAVIDLKKIYGDNVSGVELLGLGGREKNYQVLQLSQDYNRLCLKKKLSVNEVGKITIVEDVDIKFVNTERLFEN